MLTGFQIHLHGVLDPLSRRARATLRNSRIVLEFFSWIQAMTFSHRDASLDLYLIWIVYYPVHYGIWDRTIIILIRIDPFIPSLWLVLSTEYYGSTFASGFNDLKQIVSLLRCKCAYESLWKWIWNSVKVDLFSRESGSQWAKYTVAKEVGFMEYKHTVFVYGWIFLSAETAVPVHRKPMLLKPETAVNVYSRLLLSKP